uniref:Olfactory receptor family 10 subfamily J member 5 n=1 Tax=Rhinopithecus roxellana TaxID=61622 RepID=A0A2K6PY34_RHIRO
MQRKNFTEVTEFIFLGFSSLGKHQITIFGVFLTVYVLTLAGNIIIVTIVCIDHHLHTPMCFFLSMLASSEKVYTLVIVPRMLCSLIFHNQPISLAGCASQMFFFVILAINNSFLLTAMGYDRYVAICRPLRYTVIMSKGLCAQLVCGSFGIGLEEDLCHLCLPPHCGHCPLWLFLHCLPQAQVRKLYRTRPPSVSVLHHHHSPAVYSLRNKEVKNALRRVVGRNIS